MWTCFCCPLGCDDLTAIDATAAVPQEGCCALANQRLTAWREGKLTTAMVNGDPVPFAVALTLAAQRIAKAKTVSVTGPGLDLQLATSMIKLAGRLGGQFLLQRTTTSEAIATAMGRDGATLATLGDVAEHADRAILIGRPAATLPRLRKRFLQDCPVLEVDLPQTSWLPWVRACLLRLHRHQTPGGPLGAEVAENPLVDDENTPSMTDRLDRPSPQRLLKFLDDGRYLAWVVDPVVWQGSDSGLIAEWLMRLIEAVGVGRRSVLVAPDMTQTLRQALVWQTGFAGSVGFVSADSALQQSFPGGENVDLQGWLNVAEPQPQPLVFPGASEAVIRICPSVVGPVSDRDAAFPANAEHRSEVEILIGDPGSQPEQAVAAAVFVPVAWPGLTLPGNLVRGDGAVTLPLYPLPAERACRAELPNVLDVLKQLSHAQPSLGNADAPLSRTQ